MTDLKEATLHCALEIEEIWWAENQPTNTLCGVKAERYKDTRGTEWLLCSTPTSFMAELEGESANPEWQKVQGFEIHVTKCQACLDHPDLPLFILGDQ